MLTILLILGIMLLILYLHGTRTFDYWKIRGVIYERPVPFFGNNFRQFTQQCSMGMMATEMYNKYPDERVVGFFRSSTPELIVRDPEIIKRVLSTDFQHFYARGFHPHRTVVEPLMRTLFFAEGDLWRLLRLRFTPAFSSGKLKAMFPLISERAEKLQRLAEDIAQLDSYDMRELMARYATDFIGACAFGIDMDTLSSENSEFRRLGRRIFQRNIRDALTTAGKRMLPEMCKNVNFLASEIEVTMRYLMSTILKERNYKPSGRNDFIDLFLELRQQGDMIGESIERRNPDGTAIVIRRELDEDLIMAQAFVFFAAGFETSSSSSSYLLHQLAFNPECQLKIQEEIDRVLLKYDNKITYDAVKEMTYLEMALLEGLRMHPPVAFITRECRSPEYTIPEIDVTINDGVKILIPLHAIQMDEKYFEDPEKFDPDRFSPENKISKYLFMPFGEGPRACVGARLGMLQTLAGLAAVLHKFSVEPSARTKRIPRADPTAIIAEGFVGGLPLKLKKRNQ